MLRWASAFLLIALAAGALGFGGLEGTSSDVSQFLVCLDERGV